MDVATNRLSRRRTLKAAGVTAGALTGAGCLGYGYTDTDPNPDPDTGDGTEPESRPSPPESPRIDDPPNAVYKPTHREVMHHLSPVEAGEYAVSPMLTYSHEFWPVTGTETERVIPNGEGVHLMFTPWDAETGRVLPVDTGAEIRIFKDGERLDRRAPWPMISQPMGFHFGDNVRLSEAGNYSVELRLNPISARKTGAFEDRFEDAVSTSFEFEWDRELRHRLFEGVEYLDESEWGEPGALEPMSGNEQAEHGGHGDGSMDVDGGSMDSEDHEGENTGGDDHGDHRMPYSALPPADSYPGRDLGRPTSDDATFVVRYLADSRLADGDGYLLVSPRTPYNRVPLPDVALSIDGAHQGELVQTLDDEFGLHYGTNVALDPGEELELVVEAPPQVARHVGYETAFLDMSTMTIELPR